MPEGSVDDSNTESLTGARPADTIRETTIQDKVSDRPVGESGQGIQETPSGIRTIHPERNDPEPKVARHMPRASLIQHAAKQTESVSS